MAKSMKASQLRGMSDEELRSRLDESKRELFNLRVGTTTKELTDPSQLKYKRREVARLFTILAEKARESN